MLGFFNAAGTFRVPFTDPTQKKRTRTNVAPCGACLLRGFTLFELLLVLALIAVMGGMIVPALSGSFVYTKLNSAADDVQTAWANARLAAIERGQPIAFRCLIGGADFETTIHVPGTEDSFSKTAELPLETTDLPSESADEPGSGTLLTGKLADGLKFSEAMSASALDASDPGLRSNMRDSSQWSAPVIFYPDGQSSDALVRIAHKDGRGIAVTLRGLTGISRKGEVGLSGIAVEEEQ